MGLFDFLKDKKQETREITGDVLLAQFLELEKSLSEKIAALQESEGV